MDGLPLHPMIVHFPLALAVLVPALGAALWWGCRADADGGLRAFRLPFAGQIIAFVTALLAQRTGDGDHEVVEEVVARSLIHAHEEAGELFTIATGVVLVAWFAAALARRGEVGRTAAALAIALGLVAAGLGLRAGHAGAELVYVHGAADAWRPTPSDSAP